MKVETQNSPHHLESAGKELEKLQKKFRFLAAYIADVEGYGADVDSFLIEFEKEYRKENQGES